MNSYLRRWLALRKGDGMRTAIRVKRVLKALAFAFALVVFIGFKYGLHPLGLALAGVLVGICVAEAAALQSRIRVWPLLEQYLDWEKIEKAAGNSDSEG